MTITVAGPIVHRYCNVTWPVGLEAQPLHNREIGHVLITPAEPVEPLRQSRAYVAKFPVISRGLQGAGPVNEGVN